MTKIHTYFLFEKTFIKQRPSARSCRCRGGTKGKNKDEEPWFLPLAGTGSESQVAGWLSALFGTQICFVWSALCFKKHLNYWPIFENGRFHI